MASTKKTNKPVTKPGKKAAPPAKAKPKPAPKKPAVKPKKAETSKPVKPKVPRVKIEKPKKEKPEKNYRGMVGVEDSKAKSAVDALRNAIVDLSGLGGSAVELTGRMRKVEAKTKEGRQALEVWEVDEVLVKDAQGVVVRRSVVHSADAAMLCHAAELFLASYHKPNKVSGKGRNKVVTRNYRQEAMNFLGDVRRTPNPVPVARLLAFPQWFVTSNPDATAAQLLAARPGGFYSGTFAERVDELLKVDPGIAVDAYSTFAKSADVPVIREYVLKLRGHDAAGDGQSDPDFVKTVHAPAGTFEAWLAESLGLQKALAEPPIDMATTVAAQGGVTEDDYLRALDRTRCDITIRDNGRGLVFRAGNDDWVENPARVWTSLSGPQVVLTLHSPADEAVLEVNVTAPLFGVADYNLVDMARADWESTPESRAAFSWMTEFVTETLGKTPTVREFVDKHPDWTATIDPAQAEEWLAAHFPEVMSEVKQIAEAKKINAEAAAEHEKQTGELPLPSEEVPAEAGDSPEPPVVEA